MLRLVDSAGIFRSSGDLCFLTIRTVQTGPKGWKYHCSPSSLWPLAVLYQTSDIIRIQNLKRDALNRLLSTTPWRAYGRVISCLRVSLQWFAGEVLDSVDAWFELSVL